MKEEKKETGHKEFQEVLLNVCRKETEFPEGATLFQVIEALINAGRPDRATRMLFGCERARLSRDPSALAFFTFLQSGEYSLLLKEAADNHLWTSSRTNFNGGFDFEVYPEECLVIKKPTATKVQVATIMGGYFH